MTREERWGRVIAALGAAAVAGLTLHPIPGAAAAAAATPLFCLVCGDRGGVDVVLNVLLFVPFGLGHRLAGASWRRTVAMVALLSLVVELLQLTVITGRDASFSDLLSNTAGGVLGAALKSRLVLLMRPAPRSAWRLLVGGGSAWLALLGLSGWLQAPHVGDGVLTSIWAGAPAPNVFAGRVLSVSSDGVVMPVFGVPPDSAARRAALREGRISLEARVVTGPPTGGRRWMYLIVEDGTQRVFLSQQGRSAVFGVPARSLLYRLNPPTVVLPEAFPATPGVEVTVRARQHGGRFWIQSSHGGQSRATGLTLSPAHGWALLAPYHIGLGRGVRVITGVVVFALVLPLGYWTGATGGGARAAGLLSATLLLGLGAVPALQGYPPVHWSEWLAGVSAAASGWALHRAAAYLQSRCGSPSTSESFSS